jgi:hypothetical protein
MAALLRFVAGSAGGEGFGLIGVVAGASPAYSRAASSIMRYPKSGQAEPAAGQSTSAWTLI